MKKRSEIWQVNFNPSVGDEISKKRPAIIISNNTSNKHLKRYQVLPISTKIERILPCETLIIVNGKPSKAMADQLTTVSELRFLNKIGSVNDEEMSKIESIVKLQPGLE